MYLLIVFFPLFGSFVAGFFGRFLGSEGIAMITTTQNLILFSTLIFFMILLFRLYFHVNVKKGGTRLSILIKNSILLILYIFFYLVRIKLASSLCHFLELGLGGAVILSVSERGKEVLPFYSPSGTSSSSSWTEDSFEMRVLLEPFSDTEMGGTGASGNSSVARDEAGPSHQRAIVHNSSFENSIKNRIGKLETPFLLGKEKGEFWVEMKTTLDQASSQSKYNRLLEFENRDLQIRERKQECFSLFQQVLSERPGLTEKAVYVYDPQEVFIDFFDAKRDELETHPEWSPAERDQRELQFLDRVATDIRTRGQNSSYMKEILGSLE